MYRPLEDERLSWPSWLTYSGRLTHISGQPSAADRAWDRKVRRSKTNVLTTVPPRNQARVTRDEERVLIQCLRSDTSCCVVTSGQLSHHWPHAPCVCATVVISYTANHAACHFDIVDRRHSHSRLTTAQRL